MRNGRPTGARFAMEFAVLGSRSELQSVDCKPSTDGLQTVDLFVRCVDDLILE